MMTLRTTFAAIGLSGLVGLLYVVAAMTTTTIQNAGSIQPTSEFICSEMKEHHVLGSNPRVRCERLRIVKFRYVDFESLVREDGEVIVMDVVAEHVLRIFTHLYNIRFPIAKARPMEHYEGNDQSSMADNNTSAFNDRKITNGEASSLHAFGLAIDINPVQNPY